MDTLGYGAISMEAEEQLPLSLTLAADAKRPVLVSTGQPKRLVVLVKFEHATL